MRSLIGLFVPFLLFWAISAAQDCELVHVSLHPAEFVAYETEHIKFVCSTNASKPFNVTWLKDGRLPTTSRWVPDGNMLTFRNQKSFNDNSSIECSVATSQCSVKASSKLYIVPKPSIATHPGSVAVEEGDSVFLQCKVEGGPPISFTWWKDGSQLQENERVSIIPLEGLNISDVNVGDRGSYECRIGLTSGVVDSSQTNLTVLYPPTIVVFSMNISVSLLIENAVVLDCLSRGNPPPTVTWFKDGKMMDIAALPNGSLYISSVDSVDSGKYSCSVTNSLGTVVSPTMTLEVDIPDFELALAVVNIAANHVTVTWQSPGSSVHSYNLTVTEQGGSTVSVRLSPTSSNYSITELKPFTQYMIKLTAFTDFTPVVDKKKVTTLPGAPGDGPRNITVVRVTNSTAILKWEEPGTPNGEVIGYNLSYVPGEVTLTVKKASYVELEDLSPFTNYTLLIRAFTRGGVGPASPVVFQTLEGVPSTGPDNISIDVINSTSATVSWKELSASDLRGNLHRYIVVVEHSGKELHRVETNETSVQLTDLNKFSEHHIKLSAATLAGEGPFATILMMTLPSAPENGSAVVNLTATPLNHTHIRISWYEPENGINSNITGYLLTWESPGDSGQRNVTSDELSGSPPSLLSYDLGDLRPFTNYTVAVRVITTHGMGDEGNPVTVATEESIPGKPENVSVENIVIDVGAGAMLSWQRPLNPNGVITMYQYVINSSAVNSSAVNVSANKTSDIIGNLVYYTTYTVSVRAFTSAGPGDETTVVFTSGEGPPSAPPTNITFDSKEARKLVFRWTPPPGDQLHGKLTGYQVNFNGSLANVSDAQYHRDMLTSYTNYTFRVAAVTNQVGVFSDNVTAFTKATNDGGPPSHLTAFPVGDTSLNISWQPPLLPNGPIDEYVLNVHNYTGAEVQRLSMSGTARSEIVHDLKELTEYLVTVGASSEMFGAWKSNSSVYVFTTRQSVPGPVGDLVTEVFQDEAVVRWTAPTTPQGRILHYIVDCPVSAPINTTRRDHICPGLKPNTTYSVQVQAVNSVGTGEVDVVNFTTACNYTPPTINVDGDSGPTIQLEYCSSHPTFGYILVVVRKFVNSSTPPPPLNSYTIEDLVHLTSDTSLGRRRRQASGSTHPYISANLSSVDDLSSFVLGDGKMYGGYQNRELEEGVTYESTLYGENPTTGKVVAYPPNTFETPRSEVSQEPVSNVVLYVIIALAAFIAVVILVIVIIILFVCVSLCRSSATDNGSGGFSRQSSFRMSLKKVKVFDPLEVFRGSRSWTSLDSHPPVPLSGFHSRMTILQADSNFHFLQEYESIEVPDEPSYTTEAAAMMINASKNRYTNIVPFDHSRVKLSTIKGVEGSDYINANFCDGYMKPKGYIATQGPLRNTVEDFWRMVWEQQSYIIVMLTNVQERGKEKCCEYWPSGEMECFGNINVTFESVVTLADFTIRTFSVSKTTNPRDVRKVRQFQFTAWPDHGVPMFATSMLAFIRRVQAAVQEVPEGAGPVIVHCSAGVGRTGTFIVIDSMTQKIKAGGDSVDVFGHVTLLRTMRNFMVQTEDQYFFIYEAIAEYITCGYTECDMEELPAHVDHLISIGDGEEFAFIELEFKHLALEKNDPNRFTCANESFNKQKNRFVNILPFDNNRVTLEGIRGVQGSDYINGSFIDSYQVRKAFIACQAPLENTQDDFWRMIWMYRSPIIVVLTQLMEQGVEQCVRYWPTDQPIQFGDITVEPLVGRHTTTYSYREFKLIHEKSTHTVRHFHFHCWPEVGVPSTGIPLVELIKEVTKMYSVLNCTDPITVHCSSGVGRTGVFIALSIIMERMKLECVVDVFQAVKMLRIQRPAMVQTLEQYQFCYDTTVEVLSRFDSFKSLLRNSSGTARLLRGNSSEATTFLPKSPTPGASYPES